MAKFKPAGSKKPGSKDKRSNLSFIPCLVIVVLGLALVFILFYSLLTTGK